MEDGMPTDIWIADPKILKKSEGSIHDQVREDLRSELALQDKITGISSYLLEDNVGNLHLAIDGVRQHKITPLQNQSRFLDMLNRYNIYKVVGSITTAQNEGNGLSFSTEVNTVIGRNALENRREALALIDIANNHKMNNNQYLRLATLSKSLFESGQQVSLDDLAASIVDEPDDTKIDVKHLPYPEEN